MKGLIGLLILVGITVPLFAQYYYKDIVVIKQAHEKWKVYKANSISAVTLNSFESGNQPTEGFSAGQVVNKDFSEISTFTRSNLSSPTNLVSYYDGKGLLKKTLDTSDTYQSTTEYSYDAEGRILSITNTALETDNQVKEIEEHIWTYDATGVPSRMLKIKGNTDTTYVSFLPDEKGNVLEERAVHRQTSLPSIYYYYNSNNLLTDIVRYNEKAHRLLPDYIFDYDNGGNLSSMLFVPEGSNEYQKWLYEYNEHKLKTRESCFNKRKELLGKIEYEYHFAK